MTKPVHSRTFKAGNSIAVRLPKALGVGPDETYEIRRHGDTLTARRVPTVAEEAERLARFRAMLAELERLPRPPQIEARQPFEFPDRPGL